MQIGGDASAKEGWRIAVSMIYGYTKDREQAWEIIEKLGLCSEQESKVQFTMADRRINAVVSTSVGRLFDAVSALLGIRRQSSFEGEASMALEFAAEAYEQKKCEQQKYKQGNCEQRECEQQNCKQQKKEYELQDIEVVENLSGNEELDKLVYKNEERFILNTRMLIQQIVEEKMQGADSGRLAYLFHQVLAEQIVAVCSEARNSSGRNKVALSGGVFQNRLLLRLTEERLKQEGFEVLRHHMIPPNDGGIAIGQAAYGMYRYNCSPCSES